MYSRWIAGGFRRFQKDLEDAAPVAQTADTSSARGTPSERAESVPIERDAVDEDNELYFIKPWHRLPLVIATVDVEQLIVATLSERREMLIRICGI